LVRPHDRRIQEYNAKAKDLLFLQFLHHTIEHSCLAPALEASVDRVPVSILGWKLPPRASRAEQEQDGIEDLPVGVCRWPSLWRQQWLDCCELGIGEHVYADG
jgi:hypothetical protein